ncbi:trypsin-like peptidase domain-containing protein [Rhodohalobacter sp.]|uniref:trypsin-like peptidase domain-containing protein n=1 Tax=Rhodohalobacter sp. TaxID=1974210 RepID=UPI003561E71B
MIREYWVGVIIGGLFVITGCTQTYQVSIDDIPDTDPYYTSGYPITDISGQIEEVQQSLVRITSTARYRVYLVDDQMQITSEEADTLNPSEISINQTAIEESTAGTAIIVGKTSNRAYMLTCAHTVEFPDRVYSYWSGENIEPNTYVRTVAVKQNQVNMALTENTVALYSLVEEDRVNDLALISVDLNNFDEVADDLIPIDMEMGYSENLKSSSVVYVMGYPRGYQTVTRGIVTLDNRNESGGFLTDALFNRGISGGIIIASKDNFRSFDWVGMANAGVVNRDYFLVPETDQIDFDLPYQQYGGDIMASEISTLNYGLTHSIPTQTIREFLSGNRSVLRNLGRSYRLQKE